MKLPNQRNWVDPSIFNGGDWRKENIYGGYGFHWNNMQGESKVENLWKLVGPSLINGGYLKVFYIDGSNGFHCVNKQWENLV